MKILVIQLARLGDIYMSWPALRALRRKHPEAQIDLLVRPRFAGAAVGLEAVDRVLKFESSHFFEPLLSETDQTEEAIARVSEFLQQLSDEKYDLVVNWSFSPMSSRVTGRLQRNGAATLGYSRFPDGSLALRDDLSAYFYAQVGTERPSRIHLTDLFSSMIEMDLVSADWRCPILPQRFTAAEQLPSSYWVLHPGASETQKRIEPWQWARVIQEYSAFHGAESMPVVLIGSQEEFDLGVAIAAQVNRVPVINLCGQTSLIESFAVLAGARLLVGADSAPLHMASLTRTPTFNISAGQVNFWETGPKSPRSWVYRWEGSTPFPATVVGSRVASLLEGDVPEDLLRAAVGVPAFASEVPQENEFAWNLLRAMYLGADFPVADDLLFVQVIEKLQQINEVMLEQLGNPKLAVESLAPLLERGDQIFEVLSGAHPASGVLVRWLMTERTRIGPGSAQDIRQQMAECHRRFQNLIRPYFLDGEEAEV